ncbi:MAG: hypothetical protein ACE141_19425 [Bryobacteraceae bacterium]
MPAEPPASSALYTASAGIAAGWCAGGRLGCARQGDNMLSGKSNAMAALAALALIVVLTVPADAKVNFTGTWKLNAAQSKFGDNFPAPSSMTQKIDHQDPALTVEVSQSSEGGDFNATFKYTTDGKESANEIMGNPVKSVVKWEGDELVMHMTMSFDGNEMVIDDRVSLSADGKTMTMKRHWKSPMGELDQVVVLDKQ